MKRIVNGLISPIAIVFILALATAASADPLPPPVVEVLPSEFLPPPVVVYDPGIPEKSKKYESARYTQSISVLNDRDHIEVVSIAKLPDKRWHQPGGLDGIRGWKSERYKYVPEGSRVKSWVGNISVKNGLGYFQENRGILRKYPDGTRFDELLINESTERVFEHRVRTKVDGKWKSVVAFKDENEFPKGYTGLKVSCTSCHGEAGTGGYAVGLVPGGDTVLSDPLEWTIWFKNSPESSPADGKNSLWQPLPLMPAPSVGNMGCKT